MRILRRDAGKDYASSRGMADGAAEITTLPTRRILCVSAAEELGGAELVLLDSLRALRGRGAEVRLLSLTRQPSRLAEATRAESVETDWLPVGRFRNPLPALPVLRWLGRHAGDMDAVLVNDARALLYTALAGPLVRRPYVWHVHDVMTGGSRFQQAALWTRPVRYIAISRAVAASLVARGCPADRVVVVPNAVDLERFNPKVAGRGFRDSLGIGNERLLFGAVSRILPWKALETFVEAAALVAQALPGAVFVVVGDVVTDGQHRPAAARYRDRLLARRDELGLSGRLHFVGERRDIPEVMSGLDVLVHTAVDEPFGRVLVEAMASGTAVVATRGGGVADVVEDGVTGDLVPPRDAEALAACLVDLADPERRRQRGLRARSRAEERFSLEGYADRLWSALDLTPGRERARLA